MGKKNITLAKVLLYPFSILYDGVTRYRNHLYQSGLKKTIHFDSVVINVGNLTVGGTGKTPHVEYLIRLLKNAYKIATLSRGYGRKTRGFILADSTVDASVIGDEPMQFYNKFSEEIVVTVGEERILAIPELLHLHPEIQLILLDDAYQHRKVSPDINILLCDYNLPFYNDVLLPAGRLRESRKGAERADIIIVSKCPEDLEQKEQNEIISRIRNYSLPDTKIFFTKISYGQPIALNEGTALKGSVLLVSGIARSSNLESFVKKQYNFCKHLKFSDHHHYSKEDITSILDVFEKIEDENKSILITEKDMVKWKSKNLKELINNLPVFYVPVEVRFISDKEKFDQMLVTNINKRLNELESRGV